MEESIFMDRVRALVSVLDRGVYGLISIFYNIISTLSDVTILDTTSINDISTKVYQLIAIFMIFKISFSLINYIVNPDAIADKTKGGGALVRNILITFVLIIFVPFGFNLLYQLQSAIISDALIEKLIYGGNSVDNSISFYMDEDYCDEEASTSNIGDYVGLMAFKTFFQIDDQSDSGDFGKIKKMYCFANVDERTNEASVKNLLKNNDVYNAPHGFSTQKYYVVDYTIIISTIVGIVLALVFLSFCFDVAVRSIKLQFLEIIAPVPIISYIDPDKSKNGMFSKWLKEVGTTWISLFMRLLAYHIAIYFISYLSKIEWGENGLWINLLLIIGILMFAKQMPKLLENIMGIKASGSFNLNPLKKISNDALGGKALIGATAAGVGLAATGVAQSASNAYAFARDKKALKNALATETDVEKKAKLQNQYDRMGYGRLFGTMTGGFIGGARRGAVSGYKTGEKGSLNVAKNLKSDMKSGNTVRNNRTSIRDFNAELKRQKENGSITADEYKTQKYGWVDRNVMENIDAAAGVKNEYGGYGYYDSKISKLKRDIENNTQQEEALRIAAANYCATAGLDFASTFSSYMKDGTLSNDDKLNKQFAGIKALDDDTKEKRSEMKNYQEMLNARESVKKDKQKGDE